MTPTDPSIEEGKPPVTFNANLFIIFSVTLMAVLGVASITPAFPIMSIQLGVPPNMVSLVIIVFTIPGVILTPFFGVGADRYGRKTILVPSLFLFAIAGFTCAFSEFIGMLLGLSPFLVLLVFRFLQGIGAASLGSINVTLIGDLYKHRVRIQVMGYNASTQSIGTAIYPAIGGLLALFGWFFPFYLSILAIPVGLAVLLKLENPEPTAMTTLRTYFGDVSQLLKDRKVAGLFLISTCLFIMLYGAIITYLPFLVTTSFLVNSFVAGGVISLISVASGIVAPTVGVLAQRFSLKTLLLVAFPFFAIGLVFIPLAPTIWLLLIAVFLYGIGMGFAMPSIQTILVSLAPIACRAALMSFNGLVLRLGQTLGPLIMASVLAFFGITGVYWVAALIALAMIPVVLLTVSLSPKIED
ncbi:MAG: MFS transporter [Candidatus Thorarchaeota archaeon]